MRRALHLMAVFSLAGCAVDLPDEPGLPCDDQHPCSEGRDCVAGFCRDEGSGGSGGGIGTAGGTAGGATAGGGTAGGGGSAGGGTAGGGTAGGGMVVDAGSVLWRQEDGFTGTSTLGSATVTIRVDAGNEVTSRVPDAGDTSDRATANMNDAGHLPQLGHGRLKGKFRLPAVLNLRANSTFLRLENGANVVVSLTFNAMGQLVVRSDTGFVGPMALTQTVTWPGGFSANVDYTVDIAWRRGQYRTLLVGGIDAGMLTTTDPMMILVPPDQLRIGIYRYDGDAGTGWSVTLDDWALADGPTVPL